MKHGIINRGNRADRFQLKKALRGDSSSLLFLPSGVHLGRWKIQMFLTQVEDEYQ